MLTEIRSRVIVAAIACFSYGVVFTAFLLLERPGLGIRNFFYVPVSLVALAGGPWFGAAGAVAATTLYAAAILANPGISPNELTTAETGVRLAAFVTIGAGFGWFASRNRESHERLRLLAERDFLTGLPNTRAFDRALSRRAAGAAPFSLLLADMCSLKRVNDELGHPEGDRAIRRAGDILAAGVRGGDEVGRIGGDEFGLLSDAAAPAAAQGLLERLEEAAAAAGVPLTVGWALFPRDGDEPAALYRIADERLYARRRAEPPHRLLSQLVA